MTTFDQLIHRAPREEPVTRPPGNLEVGTSRSAAPPPPRSDSLQISDSSRHVFSRCAAWMHRLSGGSKVCGGLLGPWGREEKGRPRPQLSPVTSEPVPVIVVSNDRGIPGREPAPFSRTQLEQVARHKAERVPGSLVLG